MTKQKFDIEQHRPKGDGMTVPEGYFEDFAVKMAGQLPFREELDVRRPERKKEMNSGWMKVRPYVYMAAMFAGAWCLLKMFSLMTETPDDLSLENYPVLSNAVKNADFIDENVFTVSPNDIVYDLLEEGSLEIPSDLDSIQIEAVDYEPLLPAAPISEPVDGNEDQ